MRRLKENQDDQVNSMMIRSDEEICQLLGQPERMRGTI